MALTAADVVWQPGCRTWGDESDNTGKKYAIGRKFLAHSLLPWTINRHNPCYFNPARRPWRCVETVFAKEMDMNAVLGLYKSGTSR